jgi:hypothetical protein
MNGIGQLCALAGRRARRALFGWVCNLRGFHFARTPRLMAGTDEQFGRLVITNAVQFTCLLCGRPRITRWDYERGGRIGTPFTWEAK